MSQSTLKTCVICIENVGLSHTSSLRLIFIEIIIFTKRFTTFQSIIISCTCIIFFYIQRNINHDSREYNFLKSLDVNSNYKNTAVSPFSEKKNESHYWGFSQFINSCSGDTYAILFNNLSYGILNSMQSNHISSYYYNGSHY